MSTHLTIEQRRVVIDIGDFNGERANTFQRRFTLIRCFHGNGYKFTIVSFAIKYLKIDTILPSLVYEISTKNISVRKKKLLLPRRKEIPYSSKLGQSPRLR